MSADKGSAALRLLDSIDAPPAGFDRNKPTVPTARTVTMSSVEPVAIQWLWPGRIALGKLTIIAGDPGLGKSMLTASMIAHITTNRDWPDGGVCPLGSVILVSGEDDPGDTIRPRLDMAGANVARVEYMQAVHDSNGERGFNLADIIPLAGLLEDMGDCKLIVIDPVSAYLAGTDSHKNSDIRALLTPLAQMAASHSVSIVAVSHLNKAQAGNALSRVTGSLAFVAAARAAYVVVRDAENPARRLMLPIKNNLGNDQTGLAYKIAEERGVPYVVWEGDPVTITADDALSQPDHSQRGKRDDAGEFLTQLLNAGPAKVDDIKTEAKQAGHSWPTVRRAKEEIGAKSKKVGFEPAVWTWFLPLSKMLSRADTELSFFGKSEHLREVQTIKNTEGAEGAQPTDLSTFDDSEHLRQKAAEDYSARRDA